VLVIHQHPYCTAALHATSWLPAVVTLYWWWCMPWRSTVRYPIVAMLTILYIVPQQPVFYPVQRVMIRCMNEDYRLACYIHTPHGPCLSNHAIITYRLAVIFSIVMPWYIHQLIQYLEHSNDDPGVHWALLLSYMHVSVHPCPATPVFSAWCARYMYDMTNIRPCLITVCTACTL